MLNILSFSNLLALITSQPELSPSEWDPFNPPVMGGVEVGDVGNRQCNIVNKKRAPEICFKDSEQDKDGSCFKVVLA